MEAITLDEEINQYWSMLTIPQKESLLILIKSFINPDDIQRISIEQYNQELEIAENEIERGDSLSHDDVLKEIRKW